MSILPDIRFRWIIFLIIFSCVFIFTLPSPGYCEDEWVYVGKNDNVSYYYNETGMTIDEKTNIIKVWIKYVFTDKGKEYYINYRKQNGKDITNYNDLSKILELVMYDYKKRNNITMFFIESSESDDVLGSGKNFDIEWDNIVPNGTSDRILNKILEDYDIKR